MKPGRCPEQKHSGQWEQLLLCRFRTFFPLWSGGNSPEKHYELSKVTQQRQASPYPSCSSSPGSFPVASLCDLMTLLDHQVGRTECAKKPAHSGGQ